MSDAAPQHILVVEDDPTISEVVARYLEREGYRPATERIYGDRPRLWYGRK